MDRLQRCLSNNMKRHRKKLKLSQEKLAEKAGASANYIALIENGRNFPSLTMLKNIARALEVDSLDLFDKSSLRYPNIENLRGEIQQSVSNAVDAAFNNFLFSNT